MADVDEVFQSKNTQAVSTPNSILSVLLKYITLFLF